MHSRQPILCRQRNSEKTNYNHRIIAGRVRWLDKTNSETMHLENPRYELLKNQDKILYGDISTIFQSMFQTIRKVMGGGGSCKATWKKIVQRKAKKILKIPQKIPAQADTRKKIRASWNPPPQHFSNGRPLSTHLHNVNIWQWFNVHINFHHLYSRLTNTRHGVFRDDPVEIHGCDGRWTYCNSRFKDY